MSISGTKQHRTALSVPFVIYSLISIWECSTVASLETICLWRSSCYRRQLGDFVTFSTPLLQSCLTVQKMKPLVVLSLFWLQAGPQWISVGCGRTLISWTWTPYILQIVQSQFGIERNPRYGSVPIHPPSQFSHSRYSLIMSLYSPYFTIPGIK